MTSEVTISPAKNKETPQWVWVLLVLSLAINLLIAGVFVGNAIATRNDGPSGKTLEGQSTLTPEKAGEPNENDDQFDANAPGSNEGIGFRRRHFIKNLSREKRAEIRQIFFAHLGELRPYWRDVREARRHVVELIERGGYSQDELSKAIDDLGAAEAKARKAAKPMIITILEKLDSNERMLFLKTFDGRGGGRR